LRPFHEIPTDGRDQAREGNVKLNQRNQKKKDIYLSSLLFDLDPAGKAPRQVLQLMEEVAARNADRFYERWAAQKVEVFVLTLQPYHIQTTGLGSRRTIVYKPFYYKVRSGEGTNRYVICHYEGVD
jgi:hypothetical protein